MLCREYFDLKPNFISEFIISKDLVFKRSVELDPSDPY